MKISTIAIVSSFLSLSACAATTPTPELIGARQAYDQARTDPNAKLVPDSVLSAKQALDKAEAVHNDSPQSDEDRSYSYVAQRRAELSMALGANSKAQQDQAESTTKYGQLQDSLRTSAVAQLGVERGAVNQLGTQLAQSNTSLAEANARAARAMESLAKIAQVKEEARGMVITLSGQVLFVTGKAELLPAAQDQLAVVAKALQDQGEIRPIVVEGHTDSVGSESNNMKLSQDRANAVRSFLVSKGLPSDKLSAVGKGGSANAIANGK
jgi:outer membrane protein OmpA-like peptidoglycan-associated protein